MLRVSLPAAALAALAAAWSVQPAVAADGQPGSNASKSGATVEASEKPAGRTPRLLAPLSRLKQLTTGQKTATPAAPKREVVVASKPASAAAAPKSAAKPAESEGFVRLVSAEDAAPAAPPRPLPAPAAAPAPAVAPALPAGPAGVFTAPPAPSPAYAPLPGYRNDPGVAVVPGYPYLNAPLNTTPVPNVPYQVGSTAITNQAFYPQEMLYPHKYRALYPPFYYKVRGHWFVTPWGVWSNDRWELQGTEVKVNYRSNYAPFSLFHPPHLK